MVLLGGYAPTRSFTGALHDENVVISWSLPMDRVFVGTYYQNMRYIIYSKTPKNSIVFLDLEGREPLKCFNAVPWKPSLRGVGYFNRQLVDASRFAGPSFDQS